MIESLALPRTPTEPNRYFREASSRLKKPPIWLDDMKTWVNSSLYLKSIRQMENPSASNLDTSAIIRWTPDICSGSLLVEPLEGVRGVEVRVLPLPLLEVEGALGQVVERVLGLGLGGDKGLLLVLVNLLGLGLLLSLGLCGLGLLGLLLLCGGLVLRGSLGKGGLAVVEDGGELGVVDDAG